MIVAGSRRKSRAARCGIVLCLLVAACTDTGAGEGASPVTTGDLSSAPPSEASVGSTEGDVAESVAGFDLDAALAADPNCVDPVQGDPLRIGYAADLSEFGGPADGPGSTAALHLARLVNCSGGLDGRPMEVVIEDISGDPIATREAMTRLLAKDVHVLLGPPFADPAFRVLQATDGAYPVIFTGSTEPALGDKGALAFLVAFNDTQAASAAGEFALTKGWPRAATFSSPGPYFGYNTLVFTGVYEANGGEVIADYAYIPGETTDFSDVIPAIAADPPDVIYTAMFANQLIALREQLEEAGVDIEYLATDAFEATRGYSLTGIDGFYHITHAFPSEESRILTLNQSLAAAVGASSDAPSMLALAGDAIAVIADAYLRVGTTDPQAIGEAIAEAQNVQGITGVISYGGSATPVKPIYIHEVVDGQPSLAATIGG